VDTLHEKKLKDRGTLLLSCLKDRGTLLLSWRIITNIKNRKNRKNRKTKGTSPRLLQKNNLHDIDTWIFFKWIFKTFVAVLLVTNTWQIVYSIFQIGNNPVTQAAGTISTTVGIDTMAEVRALIESLQEKEIGELLGIYLSSGFVFITIHILTLCVFLVVYARLI